MTRRIRVGIVFGGRSAEHEVSILSARNVLAALDRDRFEPVLIGIDPEGRWLLQPETLLLEGNADPRLARLHESAPAVSLEPHPSSALVASPARASAGGPIQLDVVFPVLHGPMGEDGTIQGLLELADMAYVGAGVLGSALGMDKDVMKRLLRAAGVPVADFRALHKADFLRDRDRVCARAAELGFPLFTKPANLGSSVGVRRVSTPGDLPAALAHAFEFDLKALAEQAIDGREIECSVLDGEPPIASVPGEVIVQHSAGFYSYEAKYIDEKGAVLEIPARLAQHEIAAVQEMALQAFTVLEGAGMARVDFFLRRSDGALLVNELNTIPGFTAISMYPALWEASGLGRSELVSRLIDLAIERKRRRRELKTRQSFD
jgi:D-alanine-D-alanine ligase